MAALVAETTLLAHEMAWNDVLQGSTRVTVSMDGYHFHAIITGFTCTLRNGSRHQSQACF
jgi:hypothetical protein